MRNDKKQVYMSIGAEFIHGGIIAIIEKAAELGELTVGVLTDEVIMTYRGYPVLTYEERSKIISSIKGVSKVIRKDTLSYDAVLQELHPDYIVHGTRWFGNTREQVLNAIQKFGGELIEFPYTENAEYELFDMTLDRIRSMPEARRGKLRRALALSKRPLRVMEAHNGITGLIVENARAEVDDEVRQFDAMWISSLCDSTAKGKPDIELVDTTSRENTINEILEVTTKPIILDGDTGGQTEHFVYRVRTLERMGVSAIIIEDKTGLKKNSLFGTQVEQLQDSVEHFCAKIAAGKKAQTTADFMIIARIESLILEQGIEDALTRAMAYVAAGADGIMIHSKSNEPTEVLEFCKRFREQDASTPIVAVPTTYCQITETELGTAGVNIIIYANQLIRSAVPAMNATAKSILENGRALEAEAQCMSIKDILSLI